MPFQDLRKSCEFRVDTEIIENRSPLAAESIFRFSRHRSLRPGLALTTSALGKVSTAEHWPRFFNVLERPFCLVQSHLQ